MFDLYNDVLEVCRVASIECDINFNKVLQIVNGKGALSAIKEVIRSEEDIEGVEALLKIGREDLTLEGIVLEEKYKEEFSALDREIARAKLERYKNKEKVE